MTRKTARPAKAGRSKKAPPRAAKKAATVYVVVRPIPSEAPVFTDPDRVFATKATAQAHADLLNRELRRLLNPFDDRNAADLLEGGEKALLALVQRLRLSAPPKRVLSMTLYTDWRAWWDGYYFDMTDAQRDAIWDALDKFDWYTVNSTTLE